MSKIKVFIDGNAGTTGLRIKERLLERTDITLVSLPEEYRKDAGARREALNSCDVAFLCLPDDAAKEAVAMTVNPDVTVIDTSTAHRTDERFAYGFPELSGGFREKIRNSKRIAVPGCHAGGFISLIYPLVAEGMIPADLPLFCHSVTGYSGGGKKMIAQYEAEDRDSLLDAPRQYGITQNHKHLKEMQAIPGLAVTPIFTPVVADFFSGMTVTVPLFANQIKGTKAELADVFRSYYPSGTVAYREGGDEEGFLSSAALTGSDRMEIYVFGNEERILLVSRFDNLGKGSSGAALQCMNLATGCDETAGLVL